MSRNIAKNKRKVWKSCRKTMQVYFRKPDKQSIRLK